MDDISPQIFIDAVSGYQKTAAVKAAIALDLFTAIENENGELSRITSRVQASERGVRMLCDYLTVHGFLHRGDRLASGTGGREGKCCGGRCRRAPSHE